MMVRMSRIRLLGPREHLPAVLHFLQDQGELHPARPRAGVLREGEGRPLIESASSRSAAGRNSSAAPAVPPAVMTTSGDHSDTRV